ncbi:hypothetical protein BN14_12324 [Rhizoctonia solani AG-1 IB]|uniref:Vegetative incompatibility protein HET-E-1 n=1 Tax=Thanatephorus cucumeris (strain AG1-IB / isolate 7/3/14) TaxID=1108050 RepID=M5CFK8_THACB|nr:hypothetical protein BN14_12324 [Rhizoctonia solani AG-1 IB]
MRAWNVREGLVPAAFDHPPLSKFKSLCFSSDGAHVVTESYHNGIQMWSVADGTCQPASVDIRPLSPPSQNSSPDGLYTAETDEDGDLVQVIRAADGAAVAGPFDDTPRVWVFSDDSASVIVGFSDGRIEVVDLQSGRAGVHLRSADYYWDDMIAQSPDRALLAFVDDNEYSSRTLRIWNMSGPTLVLESAVDPLLTPAPVQISSRIYDKCHVDEDGWLVNSNDDMILWLPSEIAHVGLSPFVSLIITEEEVLQVPRQKLLVGSRWKECYVQG